MSQGTAQGSPDGPRYIYGKENVNWADSKRAATNNVHSDNASIQSEITGEFETEEERYDRIYDETRDKIDEFVSNDLYLDDYINFKDAEGNHLSDIEIADEYADKVSQGENADGYIIEVNFNTGHELDTAAQSRSLGLDDGTHGFPSDWQYDSDEATIQIPLQSFLNNPQAQSSLDEIKENIQLTSESGTINPMLVDDMFYEAAGRVIGDTDKRVTAADLSSFDAEDWEAENPVENFENEKEWRDAQDDYITERHDYYMDLFNEDNTREAFNELVDKGEIYMEDVSYNKHAKEFSLPFENQQKLMSKILEEYS